jgi:hypothetical protein
VGKTAAGDVIVEHERGLSTGSSRGMQVQCRYLEFVERGQRARRKMMVKRRIRDDSPV